MIVNTTCEILEPTIRENVEEGQKFCILSVVEYNTNRALFFIVKIPIEKHNILPSY